MNAMLNDILVGPSPQTSACDYYAIIGCDETANVSELAGVGKLSVLLQLARVEKSHPSDVVAKGFMIAGTAGCDVTWAAVRTRTDKATKTCSQRGEQDRTPSLSNILFVEGKAPTHIVYHCIIDGPRVADPVIQYQCNFMHQKTLAIENISAPLLQGDPFPSSNVNHALNCMAISNIREAESTEAYGSSVELRLATSNTSRAAAVNCAWVSQYSSKYIDVKQRRARTFLHLNTKKNKGQAAPLYSRADSTLCAYIDILQQKATVVAFAIGGSSV
ncbi:hypothetical protein BIW11_02916 [Tropilaelaps mercedesae]|uniref:Uncharacterized protein n=1 Tax=Tropilaelaps mercedesae TaxID=418985 RepID=A0A1V9XV83_9ACAR|nr:hypothetical protein BIW11_02916 [Tropilaelaps mercedesae]